MGWIRDRILAEKRKHEGYGADWARIAESKIKLSIEQKLIYYNKLETIK